MFDALMVAAIGDELREMLGARVQRTVQSGPLSIGIELYSDGARRWLVATAEPERSGLWLVDQRVGQAPVPPCPLLLLMRKHLRGARLSAVTQPAFERILRLTFARMSFSVDEDSPNEDALLDSRSESLHEPIFFELIVESTGRLSNIILVNNDGLIVEAIKRVPPSLNRHRTILPRKPYVGPPTQEKADPTAATEDVLQPINEGRRGDTAAAMVAIFRGMSPQTAREAAFRARNDSSSVNGIVNLELLAQSVRELYAPMTLKSVAEWHPSIARDEKGRIIAFAPYELRHLGAWEPATSASATVAVAYGQESIEAPIDQSRIALRAEIESLRVRERRRLNALEREIASDEAVAGLRQSGELLFAYARQIESGLSEVVLDDFTIVLDPALTVVENAQKLFDRYTRMRDARKRLPAIIDEARVRLNYLSELLVHLDLAETPETVADIRMELKEIKPLSIKGMEAQSVSKRSLHPGKAPSGKKGSKHSRNQTKEPVSTIKSPLKVSIGQMQVLIGRSARQNDVVTFQLAQPRDLWLHARGVAGAHVIVRSEGQKIDESTVIAAASFAAFHSESRSNGRVPVDVTERRHVRKIHHGPPGAVTYSGERTLNVEPRTPEST